MKHNLLIWLVVLKKLNFERVIVHNINTVMSTNISFIRPFTVNNKKGG